MLCGHELDVSLPCKVCNDFAVGICASCGSWTIDRHRISIHDVYWCCLCQQQFQPGATLASSASHLSGLAAHPDGSCWRPSVRDSQCLVYKSTGAAYVLEVVDKMWILTKLDFSTVALTEFGWATAISGYTVVVGDGLADKSVGANYVFERYGLGN